MSTLAQLLGADPAVLWAALGALLLVLEMLMPGGFVLSFAVAGGVVALKVLAFGVDDGGLDLWDWALFALVGVALIAPMRFVIRRYADRTKDINKLD